MRGFSIMYALILTIVGKKKFWKLKISLKKGIVVRKEPEKKEEKDEKESKDNKPTLH